MNETMRQMFADLIDALGGDVKPPSTPQVERTKSWDQKYEEELEAFARRMRFDSGLLDLDGKSRYGANVASTRRDSDGLTPEDK